MRHPSHREIPPGDGVLGPYPAKLSGVVAIAHLLSNSLDRAGLLLSGPHTRVNVQINFSLTSA